MEVSPTIALTLGDPAGIGPEIIVKAFQDEILTINTRILVIGDAKTLGKVAQEIAPEIQIHSIKTPGEGWYQPYTIDVIDLNNVSETLPMGRPSAESGKASYEAIQKAVALVLKEEVAALSLIHI